MSRGIRLLPEIWTTGRQSESMSHHCCHHKWLGPWHHAEGPGRWHEHGTSTTGSVKWITFWMEGLHSSRDGMLQLHWESVDGRTKTVHGGHHELAAWQCPTSESGQWQDEVCYDCLANSVSFQEEDKSVCITSPRWEESHLSFSHHERVPIRWKSRWMCLQTPVTSYGEDDATTPGQTCSVSRDYSGQATLKTVMSRVPAMNAGQQAAQASHSHVM